ncbi:MAG: hypothetical protein Q9220_007069 [cf. Caloplaca sp. 1 TL-2023]
MSFITIAFDHVFDTITDLVEAQGGTLQSSSCVAYSLSSKQIPQKPASPANSMTACIFYNIEAKMPVVLQRYASRLIGAQEKEELTSTSANAEAQPFYVNSPYGICLAHNGNLINARDLRHFLDFEAHRHINTESDSELMLNIFANELNETGKARVNNNDIVKAMGRMLWSYWLSRLLWWEKVFTDGSSGSDDMLGIRPLVWGSRPSDSGEGTDYMMASESVALKQQGFREFFDVLPGQAVIIRKGVSSPDFYQIQERKSYTPDIFEFCYFARPDSIIDGIGVNQSRENMGTKLAGKILRTLSTEEVKGIDVIIPIPETANTATPFVAARLKRKYYQGFVKNRYSFRTFIMPGQKQRQMGVKRKLTTMDEKFAGKNVLLIDDSIVRGTTSREIVAMTREAGAGKVYFASCAPPITHAHIYGIDLASANELIAHDHGHDRAVEEIAKSIGADRVIFQDLDDLKAACFEAEVPRSPQQQRPPQDFEVGVFCGKYVTPVDKEYFKHLEQVRGHAREMKVVEKARKAVINGVAGREEVEIAAHGCQVTGNGELEPRASDRTTQGSDGSAVEANVNGFAAKKARQSREEESVPRERMDISLHNYGDDFGES